MNLTARRLERAVRRGFGALLDWFYPRHCCHCEQPIEEPAANILCRACFGDLRAGRIEGDLCDRCGLPMTTERNTLCLDCRLEERHFDLARAFFSYSGPAASVIKSYKFKNNFHLGSQFLRGILKSGWLPTDIQRPAGVVPVPLHPRRRRERGFDQALPLGRVLSKHYQCELVRRALVRERYTGQQARLPASRRWDNVRNAFAVTRPQRVEGLRLLLVDDVMTTGMTADQCAKELKAAGAERVEVLTLARTAP